MRRRESFCISLWSFSGGDILSVVLTQLDKRLTLPLKIKYYNCIFVICFISIRNEFDSFNKMSCCKMRDADGGSQWAALVFPLVHDRK